MKEASSPTNGLTPIYKLFTPYPQLLAHLHHTSTSTQQQSVVAMKLITTIICLLGLAAAIVVPERAGPSNAELASVKRYDSRAVDVGILEVRKPQEQTFTAAIPSLSANNDDEVSVKKVRPRPHGGGNRTPVYMPPAEIMGATFAQCKARQEQCMTVSRAVAIDVRSVRSD